MLALKNFWKSSILISFDGDEVNCYIPQSYETLAELKYLTSTESCLKSSQSSRLLLCLVQDSLIGGYLLTKKNKNTYKSTYKPTYNPVDPLTFNDALCIWDLDYISHKFEHIESHFNLNTYTNQELLPDINYTDFEYSGHHLLSFLFPDGFYYCKNGLRIVHGVFIQGTLTKSSLGDTYASIAHKLEKDYGGQAAVDFIGNFQFLINKTLLNEGFSIGIDDCLPIHYDKVQSKIFNNFVTAFTYEEKELEVNTSGEKYEINKISEVNEQNITNQLNNTTSEVQKLIQENISENNALKILIDSGAKGSYVNATQITSMLGQQNINGTRALKEYEGRTLPYYNFDYSECSLNEHYESSGFISSSYIKGLTPGEMWIHCVSARVGVSDSALKTALSGYSSRKMSKAMDSIKTSYIPGLCMDESKNVMYFNYGDSVDPGATVKNNSGEVSWVDVDSLIDELNA